MYERTSTEPLLLIKSTEFLQNTISQVEHNVKEVMGQNITVRVEIVDEIPKDKYVKVIAAVSNVKISW